MTSQTTSPARALADLGDRLKARPKPEEIHEAIQAGISAGLGRNEIMGYLGLDPESSSGLTQFYRWKNAAWSEAKKIEGGRKRKPKRKRKGEKR